MAFGSEQEKLTPLVVDRGVVAEGEVAAVRVVPDRDELEDPIDGRPPISRQRRPKAIDVYWHPARTVTVVPLRARSGDRLE